MGARSATLRVPGILDACRLKSVSCDGYVDDDALRLALAHGSSANLGHLRVQTDRFSVSCTALLHWVETKQTS